MVGAIKITGGNDVYGFDLEEQMWKRITDPYTGSFTPPLAAGLFSDGTPGPIHTYSRVQYDPIRNRLYVFGREFNNNGGNTYSYVTYLNLSLPQSGGRANWVALPNTSVGSFGKSSTCLDKENDRMYLLGQGPGQTNFIRLDLNNDTLTPVTSVNSGVGYYSTADCAKGLYVYVSPETNSIRARNLANPAAGDIILYSGAINGQAGFGWSENLQAFVYWHDGQTPMQLRYLGGDPTQPAAWSFEALSVSSSADAIPVRNRNGTWGRFRIARFNDGSELAMVVNAINQQVYVFKL